MPDSLTDTLAKTEFAGLTLWHTAQGWQANLQTENGGGWRVCIEPTPVAALRAVFRVGVGELQIPAIVPPPPC